MTVQIPVAAYLPISLTSKLRVFFCEYLVAVPPANGEEISEMVYSPWKTWEIPNPYWASVEGYGQKACLGLRGDSYQAVGRVMGWQ